MNAVGKFHAESLKFDKRLIRMNEKSGLLAPGEYKRTVDALPDMKDNAVPINLKGDSPAEPAAAETEAVGSSESPSFGMSSDTETPSSDVPPSGNTSGGGFFGV